MTEEVQKIVDSLRSRPGRGGVRLSYQQAQRILSIIAVAQSAAHEIRALRNLAAERRLQTRRVEAQRDAALAEIWNLKSALATLRLERREDRAA